jgi:hypothetical protein
MTLGPVGPKVLCNAPSPKEFWVCKDAFFGKGAFEVIKRFETEREAVIYAARLNAQYRRGELDSGPEGVKEGSGFGDLFGDGGNGDFGGEASGGAETKSVMA